MTFDLEGLSRTCGWLVVAPGSDAVEHGWIFSVRKGWRIKQDTELAPGAGTRAPPPSPYKIIF